LEVTRENKAGSQNKQKTSVSTNISLRGLNLPHLDRLLIKNNSNKLPVLAVDERKYQIDHKSLEGMLRVEGRSQARQEEQEERRGRDIKAELHKIYNLRPSPKKSAIRKRGVELPRIK